MDHSRGIDLEGQLIDVRRAVYFDPIETGESLETRHLRGVNPVAGSYIGRNALARCIYITYEKEHYEEGCPACGEKGMFHKENGLGYSGQQNKKKFAFSKRSWLEPMPAYIGIKERTG
jgi:hypothetical protein